MIRVAPRDLFNDGNLLTNYGHLFIALEKHRLDDCMRHFNEEEPFDICQDMDGNTYIRNISIVSRDGREIEIFRTVNSRLKYSLCFTSKDEEIESLFIEKDNGECDLNKKFLREIKNEDEALYSA